MATVHKTTHTTVVTRTTGGGGAAVTHRTTSVGVCTINVSYPRSLPGILKIIEFFTLAVAFACMADCCRDLRSWVHKYGDYYKLFIGATVSAWLLVIIIFLIFLFAVANRFSQTSTWAVMIFNLLFSLFIFVTSALMAIYADDYRGYKGTRFYDTLIVAVVFGFISAVVLLIDFVVHCRTHCIVVTH